MVQGDSVDLPAGRTVELSGQSVHLERISAASLGRRGLAGGALAVVLLVLLTACGIVDSGGSQGIPIEPGDRTVNEQARVVLDAAALVDDPANKTFSWAQTGGQPNVTLSNPETARASFVAPSVTRRVVLTFTLMVTDEFGNIESSEVDITINDAPTSNAGPDRRVATGALVTLNGGASADDTGIDQFSWAQTGGAQVTLTGANTATPSFTVPPSTQGGEVFSFRLTVIDDNGVRATDDVSFTVNFPPTADAGQDLRATAGDAVTLDGSGSSDPENRPLTFQWTQTAGAQVTLNGANTATPSFVAPNVAVLTRLIFQLTVSDDVGATASDTVTVTVLPPNVPPVAANDGPFTTTEGGTLTIPAPGVLGNDTDADGDVLRATLASDPRNGAVTLNPNGSFSYVHDGSETVSDSFTYRANDGVALSNTATVTISITPVNDPPVAVNDTFDVSEGGSVIGNLLVNDSDPEGDNLTPVLLSPPANGTLLGPGPLGNFVYQHDGGPAVTDSFTYRAQDSSGALSNVATANITINQVNDPPSADAGPDQSVTEGTTVTLNGVGSSDPEGGTLGFQWAQTAGPTVAIDAPNSFTPSFIAPAGPATVVVGLTVTDDGGATGFDNVVVTVSAAGILSLRSCWTTSSAQTLAAHLRSDRKGFKGPLRYALANPPKKGVATLMNSATGAFGYAPVGITAAGSDTFNYLVRDARGETRYGEVTVIIEPKLMPLGDSITAGVVDGAQQLPMPEVRVGYRKLLQERLTAAGYQIDFVGGETYGAGVPGFDYQSEAHAGHTAAEIATGSRTKDLGYPDSGVYAWLEAHPADFVLLHQSPANLKTASADAVEVILDEIDRYEVDHSRQVRVLLARVIDRKPSDPRIDAYNDAVAAMVKARTTDPANPDRVVVVNQQGALNTPADLYDRLHPTPRGYSKMAEAWFKAIESTCQAAGRPK